MPIIEGLSYLHQAISEPARYRRLRARDEALEREASSAPSPGVFASAELDVVVRRDGSARTLVSAATQEASLTTMLAGLLHRGSRPAHLVPPQHFGSYTGIDPLLVSRGSSFEQSLVRFAVNQHGVARTLPITGHRFVVRYNNEWMASSSSAEPSTYAIARHRHGSSAQASIAFRAPFETAPVDVVEADSEGRPMLTRVYLKDTSLEMRAVELRAIYESLRAQRHAEPVDAASSAPPLLASIDLDAAKRKLLRSSVAEKVDLLEEATTNLWVGEPKEIRARLDLISVALAVREDSPEVQRRALEVLASNARVVQSVPVVVRTLAYAATVHVHVRRAAIEAAARLLQEADRYLHAAEALTAKYGTAELVALHQVAGGLIDAEDVEHVRTVAHRTASQIWTREHVAELEGALRDIATAAHHAYDAQTRETASRALILRTHPGRLRRDQTAE